MIPYKPNENQDFSLYINALETFKVVAIWLRRE